MKARLTLAVFALALASSVQAISFRDYYNEHQQRINAAVAAGYLRVEGQDLTDLDGLDAVPNIGQLRDLELSRNRLTAIPGIIGTLVQLRELDLSNNLLTTIPESIGNLTQLEKLHLDNNQLTAIPADIRKLIRLHQLDLHHNQLRVIPDSIGSLPQLFILNLIDNQLTAIPESIGTLPQLRGLTLINNPIPLTTEQLRAQLHLAANVLSLKSPKQEKAEHDLFSAIKNIDYAKLQRIVEEIKAKKIFTYDNLIDIAKIRDKDGNNLLHAAIQDALKHLQSINSKCSNAQGTEAEKKAVCAGLERQAAIINASYTKVIGAILACGEQCAWEMLRTPNSQGQLPTQAMLVLGPKSPIFLKLKELVGGAPAQ